MNLVWVGSENIYFVNLGSKVVGEGGRSTGVLLYDYNTSIVVNHSCRYVTILRAHSTAVSVTTSFAGWSCCGCARRSPTLECILKSLCSRVGMNTLTDDVVQSFINI